MLRIFALLRDRFSLDFAAYKTNTVARRIQRRLQMMRDETLDNYAKRLEQDEQELDSLYRDLLIGVTQFFRDADAFTSLQRRVISEVVNQKNGTNEIRVWVASCATGEEAYSVAMLLDEEAEQQGFRGEIKIFATDVHRGSIEFASEGKYSSQQLQGLSRDRLEKYFTRNGDIFQVTSKIRQMVILASHNVLRDAPFTKVDLVTCRNMLIYLRPEAQRKVLSLFHFGLRSGGFLMLGSSESPGDLSDEFEKLDSRWKIYRKRRDVSLLSDIQLSVPRNSSNPTSRERGRGQQVASTARLSERQVIAAYELPNKWKNFFQHSVRRRSNRQRTYRGRSLAKPALRQLQTKIVRYFRKSSRTPTCTSTTKSECQTTHMMQIWMEKSCQHFRQKTLPTWHQRLGCQSAASYQSRLFKQN